MKTETLRDAAVFALLVAIGVVGRLGQPEWNVTPLAATALLAGFYFRHAAAAVLVPMVSMTISNLVLPAHTHLGVVASVYLSMTVPALLGRVLRAGSGPAWLAKLGLCTLAPATVFFAVTNLAVWAFQSDYAKTLDGLALCYARALPFYGRMLAGDVGYVALVFGAAAVAGVVPMRTRRELARA